MKIEHELLELLRQPNYIPQTLEAITQALQVDVEGAAELKQIIDAYLEAGLIARIKKDRYVLPQDVDLVTGTIKFKQNGSAVLLAVNKGEKGDTKETYWISAEDTFVAMNNDRVLARLLRHPPAYARKNASPQQQWVRVIRIIKRTHLTLTGTLQKTERHYYVVPDDPCSPHDILVPPPEQSAGVPLPKLQDKVVVRLQEWKFRHLNPEGEIIATLGATHTPSAEFKAILHKYRLNPDFAPEATQEADAFPSTLTEADYADRQDCRELYTLTIDPDDAKDFDDALSLELLPHGQRRVGVHIADVSAYVQVGSALDKEARERGNSTYLVGCVVPMLPHALSSGLCSLKEAEDRLTKTVFLTFDAHGKLVKKAFNNTVIRSNKRLTYKQAYAFLKEDSLESICQVLPPPDYQTAFTGKPLQALSTSDLEKLQGTLKELWEIASKLRSSRLQKGSLDIDVPEAKIYNGPDGAAAKIERIENDESHQLIEEFMLLANEVVAEALHKAQLPFISRVHDQPEVEKLNELREVLLTHGLQVGDLTKRTEVKRLLQTLRDHPQGHLLKIQFLRSLKQACYRAQVDGHYGLHKTFYAHFTSPIRRYADLVVHRIFDHYLIKTRTVPTVKHLAPTYTQSSLNAIAQQVSLTEQFSTEAERESVKVKLLEFFEKELQKPEKTHFDATIVEVKNHGLFIELKESMAYGLIHISTLEDDLYALNKAGNAIQGRRTRKVFAAGQLIKVVIERINRYKRQIDFRLVEFLKSSPASPQSTTPKRHELQRTFKPKKAQSLKTQVQSKTKRKHKWRKGRKKPSAT